MHVLKIVFLLVLTLAIMRAASWLLGWLTFRFAKVSKVPSALIGNALVLGLFAVFLIWNSMPGEPFDVEAAVFGAVVCGVYLLVDLKWCLWDKRSVKE